MAGAIGIGILLVQIFVNSMRYYARLAELYDTQADALLASGGAPKAQAFEQARGAGGAPKIRTGGFCHGQ